MCTKQSLDDAELEIPNDRHPCKLRRLAFMVSQLSSSLAAVYSSDKKKQKDWIRIDLEACELLSRQSAMWYHHFTIGKYGMATTVYQEFLSRRSEWRTSIEGGHLFDKAEKHYKSCGILRVASQLNQLESLTLH
ncbi:hypothetical protein MJO28_003057 [Puccinia striiformis f. sp. tritici]|uniref:Uncharacterized protein n=1 Tax=Puccinia striiformis f. sp. tritici TaxID=168172 RepID=A0ACC0ETP8_9BASI|nr:hypothetical protein MJO28_003057 [Puccinia striiformis f. sp. tritici]